MEEYDIFSTPETNSEDIRHEENENVNGLPRNIYANEADINVEKNDDDEDDDDFILSPATARKKRVVSTSGMSSYETFGADANKRHKLTWDVISYDADKIFLSECKNKFAFKYREHKSAAEEKTVYKYRFIY